MIKPKQEKFLTAENIAYLIKTKEVSPVEIIKNTIETIEKRNPSINAFVYYGFDDAIKDAKRAEKAVMNSEELGLLHGVPVAIKDLFDFKPGWISTYGGIRAFSKNISHHYCSFSKRIEKSGAIIVGKTNSPIMGFRGTCDNYLFGPTKNPFNLKKNSGGSSGGSASAVADGILPIAEGTDGGGSIRIPAAWCGVYGYKPSFGLIPYIVRPNAFFADNPFLFEGPITRTVSDAALALTALAGFDSQDPYSIISTKNYFKMLSKPNIKDFKIAYSPNFDVFPVENEIKDVVKNSVLLFQEAGAQVDEIKTGIKIPQEELSNLWCRMIMPALLAFHRQMKNNNIDLLLDHKHDFPPEYHKWINNCKNMNIIEYYEDQELRTEIYDKIQIILDNYDLLITPTLGCMPVDNNVNGNTIGPNHIDGIDVNPLIGWCLTYLINFTGHPAASIPAGLSSDKMPIGMQIIGKRFHDYDVLNASKIFENLKPWSNSYHICENRIL